MPSMVRGPRDADGRMTPGAGVKLRVAGQDIPPPRALWEGGVPSMVRGPRDADGRMTLSR
ncbi:MAG: hypothetical protein JNM66_03030 [Bryobacterales bacterium]|nr:hypothetical protein [Bryobacterales bacterium]